MLDHDKSKAQLIAELQEIRQRVSELESRESDLGQAMPKSWENENLFHLIAQHAEDIIWTTDMQLRLTYASPSFERTLGYTAEEMMALTPEQFLTPQSLAAGLRAFKEEVAVARPQPDPNYARVLELEYRRKDGSMFWTEMKFSFFRDASGLPTGVLGVGRDITERKRAMDSLNQRAHELQSLQATVLEITRPHDLSDLLRTIVERAARLLNAASGGLYLCDAQKREARCVVSYNTPRDYTGVILKYGEGAAGRVAQSGEPLIVDDYRTWSGGAVIYGREKPFERLVSAPMLWQGEVIGVIHVLRSEGESPFTQADLELLFLFAHHAAIAVANARQLENLQAELTERRRAEAALSESEASLKEAQRMAKIGSWKWDIPEDRLSWSDELFRIFEQDPSCFIPTTETVIDSIVPEERDAIAEAVERSLSSGEPFDVEYRILTSSQDTRWVHAQGEVVLDSDGSPLIARGTVQDISERRQAQEKLQTSARQMTLLNELTRAALEQSDLHETLQVLADRLGELLEADGAYITRWDEAQQCTIPVAAYGHMREQYADQHPAPDEVTLTDSVLRAGHVLAVEDVFDTPHLSPRIAARYPARSVLALPLIVDQKKLGAALIAFNQQHHFTPQEIAFGEQISRQIALSVARLHTLQETERLAVEQSLLFEATRDFSAGLSMEAVLKAIARHMTGALAVAGCTVSRYEPGQERVITLLDYDNSPDIRLDPIGTSHSLADYPATRRVLELNQPLLVHLHDPNADPAERAILEQYGYTTVMLLPLAVGERILGLVELSRRPGDTPFTGDDIRLALSLANTAAVTLENARLHEEMQALAVTDSLTRLANRRAFDHALESEVARSIRYGHPVALLMLDIDSFKQYNDACGHPAGDKRLQAFARMLQDNVRDPDLVARYGGEEFVVILPFSDKTGALTLAERLRIAAEKAYFSSSHTDDAPQIKRRRDMADQSIPGYTVSIGVAACPEDARTPEGLLRAADNAELAAKRRGKNRVCADLT